MMMCCGACCTFEWQLNTISQNYLHQQQLIARLNWGRRGRDAQPPPAGREKPGREARGEEIVQPIPCRAALCSVKFLKLPQD